MGTDGREKSAKTVVCRFCGEEIPADAAACPVCGSDEQTGWSDECYLDGTDLPVDTEYQEAVEREFGGGRRTSRFRWWHVLAGATVLGLTAWGLLSALLR